jgi:hypothetical protein
MKSLQVMDAPYIEPEEKNNYSDLCVIQSAAGWYIGTMYKNPEGFVGPGSRDTDYFALKTQAKSVLLYMELLWNDIPDGPDKEDTFINTYNEWIILQGLDPRGVGYRLPP